MRISIDATGLGSAKTGTAVYLEEILKVWCRATIDHEFVIFASDHAKSHLSGVGLDHRFRFVRAPSSRPRRVLWQQTVMPVLLEKLGVDVHWGAGFVLPLLSRRRMVLTVHDLTFQLFPQVHERVKRYYFPAIMKASVRKAQAIIVISESTRQDLHRLIPASVGKTSVTLLAARRMVQAERGATAPPVHAGIEDYVLFVGTVEPRKNLTRLIHAWESMSPDIRGRTQLLVAGAAGWMVGELLNRPGQSGSIRFLGHVGDAELAGLMQRAKAFLYPSLYEGFGLPVVEAMSMGVAVLTSNVGATREIAEGAALLVDPTNEESIQLGLERLLGDNDLRLALGRLGQVRAADFSWARTSEETLEVIERAAS